MARRPERPTAESGRPDRERIVAAFMELLAERPFEEIGFGDIAARAGVSLVDLRTAFGSKMAILAARAKEIDRRVLAGGEADMAEEPARERLFDVLMRRLEIMAPEKEAVRSLMRSARRNPGLAFALNALAVRSQQWMLAAADLDAPGPRGMFHAQGLALLFASVLRTWVRDDDPGLARTMAVLDRELGRGQRWVGFLDDLCRLSPTRLCRRREDRYERHERMRPRHGSGDEEATAV
ncbi:MAG TPA: TetR/AcrR family transcriptional regulator [Xanthobacteraceae bacterium]|jgi:AcrR family transcriptional regulator|nr:TetR/AcrR family transcriptional regulator [Xanthobacteraceae bacterium]